MSRSTSFACALACALLCAATNVTAATPPAAPATGAPSGKPAQTPGSAQAATTSGTAQPAPTNSSAPSNRTSAGTSLTNGATRKAATTPARSKSKNQLQEIDWRDLLPENERKKYNPNAPAPVHGPLGEGGPPAVQVVTTTVNPELDQALVKLPGFIVPLGTPKDGAVHEFYLVPYIGEDIHVPPPPSNQMVYVRSASGVATEAVHEAYWVTGKMRVETRTTPLGTSAYSLVANKVEQYQY